MNYVIHYDIAAAFVTSAIMLHFFVKKNLDTRLTRLFSALIICSLVSTLLDIADCYCVGYAAMLPVWFVSAVKICYLLSFNSTAPIYYGYILHATKAEHGISKCDRVLLLLPINLLFLFVLTNPLHHLVFYYNADGTYHFGPLMYALFCVALYYVILSMIQAVRFRHKLTLTQRSSVYFFTLASIAAVLIQLLWPRVMIAEFAVAISVFMIYLSLEEPITYEDNLVGTYNREAFVQTVSGKIETGREFHVLGVQVEGMKYINDTIGVKNGDQILKQIAEYLMSISGKSKVFHISGVRFAIVLSEEEKDCSSALIPQIVERFQNPFCCQNIEMLLSPVMCCVSYPENVKSIEDILDTIEYSLKESGAEEASDVLYASSEALEHKRRENVILQLMKKAIQNNGFEVYYQPIYSVEKERYTSAEALVRLKDQKLGFISPEEFIPLAEKNGLILPIGAFVFDEVCKCIKEERLWEKGIEYVEVNLSVVQCMQKKMYENMIRIMDQYEIRHDMINLEITETAAAISNDVLLENMNKMIDEKVHFSMDDYGTGFSNTSHLIEYPFSIIKFDKSMVWAAMESEKAMCALKYNSAMIKEMNMHIVAEGVETKEQAEILKELGCDYFQGFYYARPVPREEFLNKLQETKRE